MKKKSAGHISFSLREDGDVVAFLENKWADSFREFCQRMNCTDLSLYGKSREEIKKGLKSEARASEAQKEREWASMRSGHFGFLSEWHIYETKDKDENDEPGLESNYHTGYLCEDTWRVLRRPLVEALEV